VSNSELEHRTAETFNVGDLAELVYSLRETGQPGETVEVIGGLQPRRSHQRGMILAYRVLHQDGIPRVASPDQLRKKRPPREALGRWEDVPYFNPTTVRA
jgi:hypothetical protein